MFGINYFFTRRYKLLSGSLKLIVHSLTYSDLTCKSVSITVIVFLRCLYGRAVSNSQSPWRRLLLLAALCIFVCSCAGMSLIFIWDMPDSKFGGVGVFYFISSVCPGKYWNYTPITSRSPLSEFFPVYHSYCSQLLKWFFSFLLALQPPSGVVFYSPLAGFSLLACEVS